MFGLQVRINFQQQLSIVTVAYPFRQCENVNASLQALRNKVMPQIVMGESFALCQPASAVKALLAFRNFANAVCGLRILFLFKLLK